MRSRKISLTLRDPLLTTIEKIHEQRLKDNSKNTLSSYLLNCIAEMHEDENYPYPDSISVKELSQLIKDEAYKLVVESEKEEKKSNFPARNSKLLKAASLELESLSLLDEHELIETMNSLISVLCNIKKALGYKKLPEV